MRFRFDSRPKKYFPQYKFIIFQHINIFLIEYYCEVYTPTDRLARGPWGAGIAKRAVRTMEVCGDVRGAGHLPANSQLPRPARQAIGKHIHAIVGRASARIRLSLRINISLTIGEIYKIVEDFSTQFSPLYLPMKYLAIISRHPIYIIQKLISRKNSFH